MAFGIRLRVWGRMALFTRPEMKVERVTYDVMTPSAARGILDSIYWKPAILWVVDRIHVLSPIKHQNITRNELGHKMQAGSIRRAIKRGDLEGLNSTVELDRQPRSSVVLVDPAYVIEAHCVLTERAGPQENGTQHLEAFKRRAMRGQCFHQPCLGSREFAANFELLSRDAPFPKAISENRKLGLMLWDIDFTDPQRKSLFFCAELVQGVLKIPDRNSVSVLR